MNKIEKDIINLHQSNHMYSPTWFNKLVLGILTYFLLVDTVFLIRYGASVYTPEKWLIIPLQGISNFEPGAILLFLVSMFAVWWFIEPR